jgi:hypothetical protein
MVMTIIWLLVCVRIVFVDLNVEQDNTRFVIFHNADLSYHIYRMSDLMPYESTRFCGQEILDTYT